MEKILASNNMKYTTMAKYTDVLAAVVESAAAAPESNSAALPTQSTKEDLLDFVGKMIPDDLEASSSLRKIFETLDSYPDKRFLVYSSW